MLPSSVYVGDFDAEVLIEGFSNCAADLSTRDFSGSVARAFAKQVPYVQVAPKSDRITIVQPLNRFIVQAGACHGLFLL